tara:strand:- start:5 stop:316 length:312 start_codon:yes stop_codon:yes gene_type:complete
MQPAITAAIVVGILITIILFIFAILFSILYNEIYQYISETIDVFLNNGIRGRGITRQRRNAIYVYPQPPQPREIEMTPIQKKNFVIIENPDSPYTLGIEYSSE